MVPPRPSVRRPAADPGLSLRIDDALIAEALAAVERRSTRGAARAPAPAVSDVEEASVDIDVEVAGDPGAGGEVTIESLSDDLIVQLEPIAAAPEASPGAAQGGAADLFAIPDDLIEEDGARPAPTGSSAGDEEEKTDPRGFVPIDAVPAPPARPLTSDPVALDRMSRLRSKCRDLKQRLDQAEAELDRERQAHQLARAKLRFAELARQESEEQRESLDRFACGLRNRVLALEEEIARLQRRSTVEVQQSRQAATESTVREILPVLDNLGLALSHAQTDLERFLPGVQMVANQFRRSLERLGVNPIDAAPGTRFDPARHEAILTLAADGIPEGHVIGEVRSGFTIQSRLLRAAQVSVAGPRTPPRERSVPQCADDAFPAAPHAHGSEE